MYFRAFVHRWCYVVGWEWYEVAHFVGYARALCLPMLWLKRPKGATKADDIHDGASQHFRSDLCAPKLSARRPVASKHVLCSSVAGDAQAMDPLLRLHVTDSLIP